MQDPSLRNPVHVLVPDDNVSLVDPLIVLWKHRIVVLALPAGLAIAVFALAWRSTPTYEAVAKGEVLFPATMSPSLPVLASFRSALGSSTLAERVLAATAVEVDGRTLTVPELSSHVAIEGVRNSHLILVRARFPSPDLAARVANTLVELAVAQGPASALNARLSDDLLKKAKADLEERRKAIEQFDSGAAAGPPGGKIPARPVPSHTITRSAMELDVLRALYEVAKQRYIGELTAGSSRRATLAVADRAVPPLEAISPRPYRNAALAFFGALVVTAVVVLLVDAARRRIRVLVADQGS